MNYLSKEGLVYFWGKLKTRFLNIENQMPSKISGYTLNTTSGSMELWSQNLNNVTVSGFYNALTCTNAPYSYATLIVEGYYLAGYCVQTITDVTTGNRKRRTQINGSWSEWTAV